MIKISWITAPFIALFELFKHWLGIFAAPFEEPEMFWILVPIWVTWFITEFFQEKHGTSFGNAISNGAIAMFASIDWTRYIYRQFADGIIQSLTKGVFLKLFVALCVLAYGFYVIYLGIKSHHLVFFIGKIRWVTYILLMFTPIVYNVIKMNLYTLLAIAIFFPFYYWVIEIFDRIAPEPRVNKEMREVTHAQRPMLKRI